jgi:hypothetical protein
MIGIVVLVALVAGLLWRVWLHHETAGRYIEEPEVVRLQNGEKFSTALN